jgi:hypothetical protein
MHVDDTAMSAPIMEREPDVVVVGAGLVGCAIRS